MNVAIRHHKVTLRQLFSVFNSMHMFLCAVEQQTQTQQIVQSIWPNSQQSSSLSQGNFQPRC